MTKDSHLVGPPRILSHSYGTGRLTVPLWSATARCVYGLDREQSALSYQPSAVAPVPEPVASSRQPSSFSGPQSPQRPSPHLSADPHPAMIPSSSVRRKQKIGSQS